MAATYNNLYLDARKRLREAGVEGAQLEARELVCCAAGISFRDGVHTFKEKAKFTAGKGHDFLQS